MAEKPHFTNRWLTNFVLVSVMAGQAIGFGIVAMDIGLLHLPATDAPLSANETLHLSPVQEQMKKHFEQYLTDGRLNQKITLVGKEHPVEPGDLKALANQKTCHVFGLNTQYILDKSIGKLEIDTDVMRAGVMIHEYTHCQTSPYLSNKYDDVKKLSVVAPSEMLSYHLNQTLEILTRESISDARAVIELGRSNVDILPALKDGIPPARRPCPAAAKKALFTTNAGAYA